MTEFAEKVAIVMGAFTPGGMGEATARRLAREGAKVVVSGLGREHLDTLAADIGGSAFEADITDESQVRALVDHAVKMFEAIEPIRDLTFIRRFPAPCPAVFRAFIDPAALARWWGPSRFRNPVCEIDARPGGMLRIHMTAPDGAMFPCRGVVQEVRAPEFLAFTLTVGFCGETLLEALIMLRLEAEDAGTRLTLVTRILHAPMALSAHLTGMARLWGESLVSLTYLMEHLAREDGTEIPETDFASAINPLMARPGVASAGCQTEVP